MPDVEVVITPTPDVVVEVTEEGSPPVSVTLTPPPEVVEVQVPGPAGPPGEQGEPGAVGSDKHYRHIETTPASTWTVVHGLGKYPTVGVVDSTGTIVFGGIHYDDINTVTITFSSAISGEAYCN